MKKCCLSCVCGQKSYLPQRYVLVSLCFCGVIVGYSQRVSLNLAITVMTDKNVSRSESCPARNVSMSKGPKMNITGGVIDWSNEEQNWIIGAFFSGYFLARIPVELLCDRYGGRPMFLGGIAISTTVTMFTPIILTRTPFFVAVLLRIIMGLAQSVIYPAIGTLYARWVPLEERGPLEAFSIAGSSMGVIFGNMVTGGIIHFTRSWPRSFYAWAVIGLIWCFAFGLYVYSKPGSHRWITDDEKTFLDTKIVPPSSKMKIPWTGILTSAPVWGLIVGEIGHDFTIYTLMNSMPKYLSDVLQYDITDNAILSSLPYTTQWFGNLAFGKLAEYLIKKKDFPETLIRKIMTSIGLVASPIFLVLGAYMGCNGSLVVPMFAVCMLLKGPFFAGLKVNHLKMTVNFPGILVALYNAIGAMAGQISAVIVNIVAYRNTLEQWAIVYWIMFIISVIANVIYCVFCTDRRLKWDVPANELEEYLKGEEEEKAKRMERKAKRKAAKASRAEGV